MTIKTPRLRQNRHGVFCFRLVWQDAEGRRREAVRSLGTKDPAVARLMALKLNLDHERQRLPLMPKLPRLPELPIDPLTVTLPDGAKFDGEKQEVMEALAAYKAMHGVYPPLQQAIAGNWHLPPLQALNAPQIRSKPFGEVVALYLKDKEGENAPGTLNEKAKLLAAFPQFFEDDALTVAGVTKEKAQLWKASLKAKGNSGNTVNHRLSTLIDLYKWAIDHGHATENPFQGLKVKAKTAKDRGENYKPFTEDELKAIFDPARYSAKFGHRPDYHWLPLLALFSGARLEELGGMKAADVMTTDGVHVLSVIRRKTKDSRRKIPVHPTLIRLGFLDYAAAVQASGETDLFPNNRKAGDKGASLGDAFAEYLDTLNIKDPEKVFHSFRSTVISQFAAKKAHAAHSRQIVGHAKGDIHDTVYTHLQYGDGLRELADTVAMLAYPFLDFDALKAPDPSFTAYLAKWKQGAAHRARLAQGRVNNVAAKAKKAAGKG